MADQEFWQWLVDAGLIEGDPTFYTSGDTDDEPGAFSHAIQVAYNSSEPGSPERIELVDRLVTMGAIQGADTPEGKDYWYTGTQESLGADFGNLGDAAESFFGKLPPAEAKPVDDLPGTKIVGTGDTTTVIPVGMRLVRISDPAGTDAATTFFLVGDVYGVSLAYQVGTEADLNAMFGGTAAFGNVSTMTQSEFDGSDMLTVGSVDEIAGATGSLQAQFDRDMRSVGFENPPAWVMSDQTAMVKYVTAVNEGWSGERMWNAMKTTDAFGKRFAGFDTVMDQLGTSSLLLGVQTYIQREATIRSALISNRGPNTDTSVEYVSSLIGSGWIPTEVQQLLGYEARVKANPDALDNVNEILAFQGLPTLNPDDFVSFLQDQDAVTLDPSFTPGQLYEGINDALRFQALMQEGLDISTEFASDLGEGTSTTISQAGAYTDRARAAAIEVARNADDLELGRYDLQRDDIVAAMFGEESPSGKATSEVSELLEKMGRERSKKATGFASVPSYVDALGRLRVQGFSNL